MRPFFLMCILFLIMAPSLSASDLCALTPEAAATADRIKLLQKEISTINLLNGLNLSKIQEAQLLDLGRQYVAAQKAAAALVEINLLKNTEASLSALRSEIQKGMPARGEVPQSAAQLDKLLKETREQAIAEATAKIEEIDAKLNKLLSAGQLMVIDEYKACLIPPANLQNPVRAGQAADSEHEIRQLRKLRETLPDKFSATRDKMIADALIKTEEHKMRLTDVEKRQITDQWRSVVDKARKMSDTKFELEKENLGQQLKIDAFLDKIRQSIADRSPHNNQPKLSKAGRFLLNPEIVPILEERIKSAPALLAKAEPNSATPEQTPVVQSSATEAASPAAATTDAPTPKEQQKQEGKTPEPAEPAMPVLW